MELLLLQWGVVLLLIGLFIAQAVQFSSIARLRKQEQTKAKKDVDHIISQAQYEARSIIKHATIQSDSILKESKKTLQAFEHDLDGALQATRTQLSQELHQQFSDVIVKTLQNMQTDIQEMKQLRLDTIHQELQNYKEEQIKATEEKIRTVTQKAIMSVLEHGITYRDQETLVYKALRDITKDISHG